MSRKELITGCTFVKDEESLIEERLLQYLDIFDHIIAIDDSTDNTTNILTKYNTTIVWYREPWHASNIRNTLASLSTTPWVWFFFPDEKLDTTMSSEEVRAMVYSHTDKHNVLYIKRWNEMGSEEEDGWKYPDWQSNIIRNYIRYTKPYHEVPLYSEVEPPSYYPLEEEPIRLIHLRRPCDIIRRDATKWERRFGDI